VPAARPEEWLTQASGSSRQRTWDTGTTGSVPPSPLWFCRVGRRVLVDASAPVTLHLVPLAPLREAVLGDVLSEARAALR